MLFNSVHFFIFFPVVTAAFFLSPQRQRWLILLIASCYFYMAFIPMYILILCFTIILDYFAGILIERAQGKQKRYFLILSLVANIGVLAFFKYFNFLNANMKELAQFIHWNYPVQYLSIILPIGLSFHTFQSMSYTIEVYKGRQKAEMHFGIFALYVMFYPQLVAGPIERPQNLLHQFREKHEFVYKRVTDGLKLMLWGLFKKVCIADQLTGLVDQTFSAPRIYPSITLFVATVFFAFQIYCDFSGYSDIAIGSAQVMGFKLMKNFNGPYFSRSISEFWKRWHISLSTWFKDYLYVPLGGNRVVKWRWYYNLMITFVLSGLWHGANWTYIAWGALNGFYLLFGIWTAGVREKIVMMLGLNRLPRVLGVIQVGITFSLTCLAWVLFRAKNISDAAYIIYKIPGGIFETARNFIAGNMVHVNSNVDIFPAIGRSDMFLVMGFIGLLEVVHLIQRQSKGSVRQIVSTFPTVVRWPLYYALIFVVVYYGHFGAKQFIYFQF